MSKTKDVNAVLDAIVENGLDFVEASVEDINKRQKFSVAHFATGLELLLKARLFCEHWSLIAAEPHKATWSALQAGQVVTVQASNLCSCITASTGKSLKRQEEHFKKVFGHRNRVLHFVAPGAVEDIVTEQLTAWFHLHGLITGDWSGYFESHLDRVQRVERTLLSNVKYLQARFDEKKERLTQMSAGGLVGDCPSCTFAALVVAKEDNPVPEAKCEVCLASFTALDFGCGNWSFLEESTQLFECECGEEHDVDRLVEELDATFGMSPKDAMVDGPGVYHCGTCLDYEPRVVGVADWYVCLGCGERFYPSACVESCDYCSELWVGYDTEATYITGCEFCDGALSD